MSLHTVLIISVLYICSNSLVAQDNTPISIESLPGKLEWIEQAESFTYESEILKIHSGSETDMFIDPQGEYKVLNAPGAVFKPSDYFQLSAKGHVNFKSKYDAGVLILYAGFLSQSPTGRGCETEFKDIVYTNKKLEDLRNGS